MWWDDEPYTPTGDDPYYVHACDPRFDPWEATVAALEEDTWA